MLVLLFLWTLTTAKLRGHAAPHGSTGCGQKATEFFRGMATSRMLWLNGVDRTFQVFVPTTYNVEEPTMVIYSVHGWYGTGFTQERDTQWSKKCSEENCIVIYPNGYRGHTMDNFDYRRDGFPTLRDIPGWNSCGTGKGKYRSTLTGDLRFTCNATLPEDKLAQCPTNCGGNGNGGCDNKCVWGSCSDDTGFFEMLMNYIEAQFCVDLDRQYIDGMSNGAMFVYEIGRSELVSRFAAGVSASGSAHIGFNTEPPIEDYYFSILDVHGALDPIIPANATNGHPYATDGSYFYTPIDEMLASYGHANGCKNQDHLVVWENKLAPLVWCRQMYKCNPGVNVIRCSWGGGHTWPKTNTTTYADFVYEFMKSHPRKPRAEKRVLDAWSDAFHGDLGQNPDDHALMMRMIALSLRP